MLESLTRPCRPAPLAVCAVLSLLVSLLYSPGAVGALLHAAALLVVLRYGYLVIEMRSWGSERDSISDWTAFNQGFEEPLKLVGVIAVFALIYGVVMHYGGAAAAYAFLALANIVAPASALIIGLDGSFVSALSPGRIAALIARTGFDYFAACFVLALFSLTGNIVLDLLVSSAAPPLKVLVFSFCSYYYVLVVFFMMGWLVERHREDLMG